MQAEIISIGDELTSGQRLDTNTQWLAQRLSDLGIHVLAHSTISDDMEINVETFRTASQRANIIVCTGGLGPTKDDLTREALAAAFNLPLETYPDALAHIEKLFQARQRPMPERNKVQALFPRGSRIIPNPHGTAPGIDLSIGPSSDSISDSSTNSSTADAQHVARFFALPGVPAEMKQMWEETVLPRLISECGAGKRQIRYATLKCFGIGESEVEVRMPDLIARDRTPRVGITASRATITLRIAAEGESLEDCRQIMAPTIDEIRQRLGDIVYSDIDEELPDTLVKMLQQREQSVATIEYGEAALLGHWLALAQDRHPPHSNTRVYRGAISFGNLAQAARFTDRANTAIEPSDLNSQPLATSLSQIAQQAHLQFDADWVVLVGPYPRAHGNSNSTASGNTTTSPHAAATEIAPIDIFVSRRHGAEITGTHKQVAMSGHPDVLNHRIAKAALDQLRYSLLSSSS